MTACLRSPALRIPTARDADPRAGPTAAPGSPGEEAQRARRALLTERPVSPMRCAGGPLFNGRRRARRRAPRVALRAATLSREQRRMADGSPGRRPSGHGRMVPRRSRHGAGSACAPAAMADSMSRRNRRSHPPDAVGSGVSSRSCLLRESESRRGRVHRWAPVRARRVDRRRSNMPKAVAGRILSQGRLGMRGRGFHHGAPVPHFFQGLAGIGYQLLRTSSPPFFPRCSPSSRRLPIGAWTPRSEGHDDVPIGAYHIDRSRRTKFGSARA